MAAESSAGATPSVPRDWHSIDWKKAHVNVRRLQARIVQAMKAGKWGKVKALQHLLTRSFSAKALAVKRVTENQGKNTPGVDKVSWKTPTTKEMAIQELRQRGYTALPLRRLYIPKANGKQRPLGIPTMKDRAMQALYLQSVDPIAETQADPNSYGFRKERSCADAIEQCHTTLAGRGEMAPWILEGDIKSCFDSISSEWLQENVIIDKEMLRKWLAAGYIITQNDFNGSSRLFWCCGISSVRLLFLIDISFEMAAPPAGHTRPPEQSATYPKIKTHRLSLL